MAIYGKGPQQILGNGPLASERVSVFKFQLYPGFLVNDRDGTILISFCGYKPCLFGGFIEVALYRHV